LDVLALGVAGFLSPLIPRIGGAGMLVCFAAAFIAGARRPTMGAYEGEDGLVVRNYFRTRLIPWRNTVKVSSVGDMALPFVHVGAVELVSGLRMRVTALRYVG